MFKKFIFTFLGSILLIVSISVFINVYKNNPSVILRNLKNQINETQISNLKTHSDWLWQSGRTFVFDVIYMDIITCGTATMHLKEDTYFNQRSVFTIEAVLEPNDFFKKIYDVKMVISGTVQKDTKLSLRYREESFMPDKKRTKEIRFDPLKNIAEREGIKYRIPDNTYDPLSVFFNFLDHQFNIGETFVLKLLSKEDIYDFKATPVELKNNIYKLAGEVFRENRSSSHGARFMLWVKDGEVRVPLLIKVISAAGPVYLRLKEIK